jgi:hypothetical protein
VCENDDGGDTQMKYVNRKVLVVAAVTAVAGSALVVPSFASTKKTYKVTCKLQGTKPGSLTDLAANISCPKPFGKGKQTGTLKIPISKGKWTFKGCSFAVNSDRKRLAKLVGTTASGGYVLISKGTGKCKGIKGEASLKGDVVTSKFTYKLKVKF